MSTQEYKYAEIAGYRLELIDGIGARVKAENGASWLVPSSDKEPFNAFLLEFVRAMIDHQNSIDSAVKEVLEKCAQEAEHWQKISSTAGHKCGEYIAAAIRALGEK